MNFTKTIGWFKGCVAAALFAAAPVVAGQLEAQYAVEDAAFQAIMQMSLDPRVAGTKNIAFTRLMTSDSQGMFASDSDISLIFEGALGQVPADFRFVLHSDREEWKDIDKVFDQASDFTDYAKNVLPVIGKLKLADALLLGQVVGAQENSFRTIVRVNLRLYKVETSELLWSGTVEGTYDDMGPDNEQLPAQWRRAVELAAEELVRNIPADVDGYGSFLIPFDGPLGRAMSQVFLNEVTRQGRQNSIVVYDLPNGGASDRMMARFLRQRAGTNIQFSDSVLDQLTRKLGPNVRDGRMAVLNGSVTVSDDNGTIVLDPTGKNLDRLTLTTTPGYNTRYEVVTDVKFRDIGNSFKVVAAAQGRGVYSPDWLELLATWFRSVITPRNFILLVVVLAIVWFVTHTMIRVR